MLKNIKHHFPSIDGTTKRLREWSGTKKQQNEDRSSFQNGEEYMERYLMSAQTLDVLLRELSGGKSKSPPGFSTFGFERLTRDTFPTIDPISVQLLAAQVGPFTRDLADYMSKEAVGQCFLSREKSTRPASILTYLDFKLLPHKPKEKIFISKAHNWACKRTRSRHFKTLTDNNLKTGRLFTTHRTQMKIPKPMKIKRGHAKKTKYRRYFPYLKHEINDDTWTTGSNAVDLMLEDVEETDEEEHRVGNDMLLESENLKDVEKMDSHHSDSLRMTSIADSLSKSYGTTVRRANYLSAVQSQASSVKSETFFKKGSSLIPRVRNLSLASLATRSKDEKACFIRLLYAIASNCTPERIIARSRKLSQITYDLSPKDYPKVHGPPLIRDVRCRLLMSWHRVEFILNNREVMEHMAKTLKDMHKRKLMRVEHSLRRKEYERVQSLILRDAIVKEVFDAELRQQGELLHQKQRRYPAIFLPKNIRGKDKLPEFCINPLRVAYVTTYNTQKPNIKLSRKTKSRKPPVSFVGSLIGSGSQRDSKSTLEQQSEGIGDEVEEGERVEEPLPRGSEQHVMKNLHKRFIKKKLPDAGLPECFIGNVDEGKPEKKLVSKMYTAAAGLLFPPVKHKNHQDKIILQREPETGARTPINRRW